MKIKKHTFLETEVALVCSVWMCSDLLRKYYLLTECKNDIKVYGCELHPDMLRYVKRRDDHLNPLRIKEINICGRLEVPAVFDVLLSTPRMLSIYALYFIPHTQLIRLKCD